MSNTQVPTIPMFVIVRDKHGNPFLIDIDNIAAVSTDDDMRRIFLRKPITQETAHTSRDIYSILTLMTVEEIRAAIVNAQSDALVMIKMASDAALRWQKRIPQ